MESKSWLHKQKGCSISKGGSENEFFWEMLFDTSFSEQVFTTDSENQGEICWKPKFNCLMATKMWPPANLRIFQVSQIKLYCIPFDAEFYAEFKNAQLYMAILSSSRDINKFEG